MHNIAQHRGITWQQTMATCGNTCALKTMYDQMSGICRTSATTQLVPTKQYYIYIYIYMRIHLHIHIHIHIHMYTYICIYTAIHICMYVYIYIYRERERETQLFQTPLRKLLSCRLQERPRENMVENLALFRGCFDCIRILHCSESAAADALRLEESQSI